jgi:hypothetical protein
VAHMSPIILYIPSGELSEYMCTVISFVLICDLSAGGLFVRCAHTQKSVFHIIILKCSLNQLPKILT